MELSTKKGVCYVLCTSLVLAFTLAQSQWVLAQPRQAPPVVLTYAEGQLAAKKTDKPLVVFVGFPSRPVENAIYAYAKSLPGYPTPCVVVTERGGGAWRKTLFDYATDKEIQEALPKKEVQAKLPVTFQRATSNC